MHEYKNQENLQTHPYSDSKTLLSPKEILDISSFSDHSKISRVNMSTSGTVKTCVYTKCALQYMHAHMGFNVAHQHVREPCSRFLNVMNTS